MNRTLAVLLAASVALLAAACATPDVAGNYEGVLPAASGGSERHVGITLDPNGGATVTSAFSGRPSRFLVKGTWRRDGDRIAIELVGSRSERLVFEHAGDRLVAREWDRASWGETGPGTLRRVK